MLQFNPRLLNPEDAFITETGEVVTICHSLFCRNFDEPACVWKAIGSNSQGKHLIINASELTFLTSKYEWPWQFTAEELRYRKERAKWQARERRWKAWKEKQDGGY